LESAAWKDHLNGGGNLAAAYAHNTVRLSARYVHFAPHPQRPTHRRAENCNVVTARCRPATHRSIDPTRNPTYTPHRFLLRASFFSFLEYLVICRYTSAETSCLRASGVIYSTCNILHAAHTHAILAEPEHLAYAPPSSKLGGKWSRCVCWHTWLLALH
jgi:hypothetical protein